MTVDQFFHALIWKAGPIIILFGFGAFVFREVLHRIARRIKRNIRAPRVTRTAEVTPHCPTCNRPMVKRTSRRGFRAGAEYWGCSNYPSCTDTRALAHESLVAKS